MIELNGAPFPVWPGQTMAEILQELHLPSDGRGIAVAVDGEVIPKGNWAQFVIRPGAKVELVRAVQGG